MGPGASTGPRSGAPCTVPARGGPAWQRRQHWLHFTRVWAFVKMAILAYSTWWAMDYIHARLGARLCGYGAVCLFSAVSSRWRKRYFGPGQQLEPEVYEVVQQWLYGVGTVLVLVGGAIAVAQAA